MLDRIPTNPLFQKRSADGSRRRLRAVGLGIIGLIVLVGCAPPGQRLFDADAGKRPQPPAKPVRVQPAVAPFIVFSGSTSEREWVPAVDKAIKYAVAKRPDLFFKVVAIFPRAISVDAQATEMTQGVKKTLRSLLDTLHAAGAEPSQILISSRVDPTVDTILYRIDPQ